MNDKIMEYVSGKERPDFFRDPEDTLLRIHSEIEKSILEATETITIELDMDLAIRAEKFFRGFGWALEEAAVLFLYWCISDPERTKQWAKNSQSESIDQAG
ncbi:MAG: hypothetical protein IJ153_07010 [Clostridia bacterium]|nr:hypothetical protein [Clostridia bacterium]